MPTDHKALPGDCVCSLAVRYGLVPKDVWNLPQNEKLRKGLKRAPEVIAPGDRVHLPDRVLKWESRGHGQHHPFQIKTIPFRLKIRFLDNGEPRASVPYILQIDGKKTEGTTDSDGLLDEPLPPQAADVRIRLGDPQTGEDFFIKIGHLDPVERLSGVQQRLHNLGFHPGPADNIWGPRTRAAVHLFQKQHDLPPARADGKLDEATLEKLLDVHGS